MTTLQDLEWSEMTVGGLCGRNAVHNWRAGQLSVTVGLSNLIEVAMWDETTMEETHTQLGGNWSLQELLTELDTRWG